MTDFVHLHNHTDYSLLDGAGSISKYVKKAKELGMKALAITDHGNMFGAMEFYSKCKAEGIMPIIGCEFYITEDRNIKTSGTKMYHLILLACSDKGYHNLMELNSIAWTEGYYYKPRIDEDVLFNHSEGLICLSACLAGELPRKILAGEIKEAYDTAKKYKDVFKDRYYIELQNHNIKNEIDVIPQLYKLSKDLDIPTVATNDIHYANKEDAVAHDILLCIGTGKKQKDTDRLKFETQEFYMKTQDEMAELFKDYPESISNTVKIAEKCNFELNFPGPLLPEVDVPEGYLSTADYLEKISWKGLKERYPDYESDNERKNTLTQRLKYELDIIIKMQFDSYFLIVSDYVNWAKNHAIPVGAGRGSGAGSLVAYCIKITDVDPIKYDLLFERFLNPERVSLPDFDVDFCYEGRQDVINYVTEKYGKDRVGQIATFGTLKAKAVVKDVARVLDIPFNTSNEITRYIGSDLPEKAEKEGYTSLLQWSLDTIPELKDFLNKGGIYEELFDASLRLENLSRHISTHACGIVIGKTPLKDYVPLYMDPKTGSVSTQYTMDKLEKCGLVKMDFLGLKTLTLIRDTENLIKKNNPKFDITKIPLDDKATYAMMANGDSTMVFQFESGGMQKYLKELKPVRFEELDAMTSLYRPGPMEFIPQYISSKNGVKKIEYPDPSLEELLSPTYGVIVYQEQVMRVSQIIAGFSLSEADNLRKIMGKKLKDKIPKEREKFIEGAVKNGHSAEHAKSIFDMIEPFAGYGFNKSHSICYTVLSYRTAYLKCHYPSEFFAANLSNERGNPDKFKEYLTYVRGKGINILPPSINKSGVLFTVDDKDIVYGLSGVKGLGEVSVGQIIEEREKHGCYKSFVDFIERSSQKVLNSGTFESLVFSGCLDCLGYNRRTLIENFQDVMESLQADKEAKDVGQSLLFEDDNSSECKILEYEDFDVKEKLKLEKEYIGFYLSGHPLDKYKDVWKKIVKFDFSRPDEVIKDSKYSLIGVINNVQTSYTKRGNKMIRFELEDYNGVFPVVIFEDELISMSESFLVEGNIIGIRGHFILKDGRKDFRVDNIYDNVKVVPASKICNVCIELDENKTDRENLSSLLNICLKYKGEAKLYLIFYSFVFEHDNINDDNINYNGRKNNSDKSGKRTLMSKKYSVSGSVDMLSEIKELDNVINIFTD